MGDLWPYANYIIFYSRPKAKTLVLTLDDGTVIPGVPVIAHDRDDAHLCELPAHTPVLPPGTVWQGALLTATCWSEGYVASSVHGSVLPNDMGEAYFRMDQILFTKP